MDISRYQNDTKGGNLIFIKFFPHCSESEEKCQNPLSLWTFCCTHLLQWISFSFGKAGGWIARHPWCVIILTHFLVFFLATGFIFINFEKNTAKLYNPQNSQAEKDLTRANKYFPLKFRREMVILRAKNQHPQGVLTKDCFMDALRLHRAITSLKDYKEYCMKDPFVSNQCIAITPLEIFHYNPAYLRNITTWLTSAYRNKSYLMSNNRPAYYNFPAIFGTSLTIDQHRGTVERADALQMIYVMNDPSSNAEYEKMLRFEKAFLDTVAELKKQSKFVDVFYSSARSIDDAVNESSFSDFSLFFITFLSMIIFACLASANFVQPRKGHALLATSCVIAVSYGIVCGLGFGMWLGVPFISIVGFLPFLILGIGLDDMFIIVNEFDRLPRGMSVVRCVSIVMTNTGSSITMTTVTTLAAYLISTSTAFLALRYFCLYATFCITFSYLFVVGFFVAALSLDGRRIKAGRLDCLPCLVVEEEDEEKPVLDREQRHKKRRNVFLMADRIMRLWAEFILRTPSKIVVLLILVGMIVCGVIAGKNIDQRFDNNLIAKPGSYLEEYLQTLENYYSESLEVDIIIDSKISYKSRKIQNEVLRLSSIARENKFYNNGTLSWMEAFRVWSSKYSIKTTGRGFIKSLKTFLTIPAFRHFSQDIVFSKNRTEIIASRVHVYMKSTSDTMEMCQAMVGIREDLKTKSKLPVYAIAKEFLSFETYSLTFPETIRNIFLSSLTIVLITSVYLVHPVAIFLVFINFLFLVIELLGILHLFSVPLNTLAMVGFVMAVGYSVDYSAHIAHAFILSPQETAKERTVHALATVGSSVFWGGERDMAKSS